MCGKWIKYMGNASNMWEISLIFGKLLKKVFNVQNMWEMA